MNCTPGFLINARGRDWIIQSGSTENMLCLRPLTGSDDDIVYLIPSLEKEPVRETVFTLPDPHKHGAFADSAMFRTASILRLKSGTGPVRAIGSIAVDPRSFQLTPLLMALSMDTVRLLIADDVGVGKTIEACLIAKEMMIRYEIDRFSVICPSHLVSQWASELKEHFNLDATAITASSVYSLEKKVPAGMSLTEYYPITVISLDYIKNQKRRDNFAHTAPDFIIVDEAHSCTEKSGASTHLRYELLETLSRKQSRHMIFLTATPHSGDQVAFANLLALIDPKFRVLADDNVKDTKLRQELALHMVQRQRKDLDAFSDNPNFAHRLTNEFTYRFNDEWKEFFDDVRNYCESLSKRFKTAEHNNAIWYAILALYRSIASSPASAIKALETRLRNISGDGDDSMEDEYSSLFDNTSSDVPQDLDISLSSSMKNEVKDLLERAYILKELEDPKFNLLVKILKNHIFRKDEYSDIGYTPIIFCKYIATANYVGEKLRQVFPSRYIEIITGEFSSEEREERVNAMQEKEQPILVATDCLSEGINLQNQFTAVIHYDLAWNPTRHEQREGRIDRFGQSAKYVKCVMLYGSDNPIDGLIFKVILRKAQDIRNSLGVLVPVPEDGKAIRNALMQATLLKEKEDKNGQLYFDFGEAEDIEVELQKPWQDAYEKAKRNRTVFAQARIHSDEVMKILNEEKEILGSDRDTEFFVSSALKVLGACITPKGNHCYDINLSNLQEKDLLQDLKDDGVPLELKVSFTFPAPTGKIYLHRSHPICTRLSSYVFENVLAPEPSAYALGSRSAVTETHEVTELTYIFLVRVRIQVITLMKDRQKTGMAEETLLIKETGGELMVLQSEEYHKYLNVVPSANLNDGYIIMQIEKAQAIYECNKTARVQIAQARANKLLDDLTKYRNASNLSGLVKTSPCGEMDLLGTYVFVPSGEDL